MIRSAASRSASIDPSPSSPRDRDNRFYQLLAGGARTRLLEGFLELRLPELLGSTPGQSAAGLSAAGLSAAEICRQRQLDPHRGWKFLHLLALAGLVSEEQGERGEDGAVYRLSPETQEFFGADGREGYFFRELVTFWRNVAVLPLVDVLQGMPLPEAVRWPPPHAEAAEHLETWMRVTAQGAIRSLVRSGALAGVRRLLDVGGGDGTIGCALVDEYPELEVTVFNLPASAHIARRTIAECGKAGRVHVHEGDFLGEELPGGFDGVLFSRVLTDWSPQVCQMLFEKSRRALTADGRLVINEALVEGNGDYTLAWEFRYMFYDTFGRALLKPLTVYEQLLAGAGFAVRSVAPMTDDSFYSVIEAI